eukprot:CAMPEP_0184095700 /NCGR_PEP_ID=MMETSP0974-20121125/9907_1 /TAXON_ID=483370 /ORGANISM="non described non described, Strain CCMP2097" /LENGTH=77 /DNA_ID=CAMNT_0026398515 /DNA_START=122 /DNA_END=352 /DNA_ORIENTATION=-
MARTSTASPLESRLRRRSSAGGAFCTILGSDGRTNHTTAGRAIVEDLGRCLEIWLPPGCSRTMRRDSSSRRTHAGRR